MTKKKISEKRLSRGDMAEFNHPTFGWPADQKIAAAHLTNGESYTVAKKKIHSCHTSVWLEGVKGGPFNSVLFDFFCQDTIDKNDEKEN